MKISIREQTRKVDGKEVTVWNVQIAYADGSALSQKGLASLEEAVAFVSSKTGG